MDLDKPLLTPGGTRQVLLNSNSDHRAANVIAAVVETHVHMGMPIEEAAADAFRLQHGPNERKELETFPEWCPYLASYRWTVSLHAASGASPAAGCRTPEYEYESDDHCAKPLTPAYDERVVTNYALSESEREAELRHLYKDVIASRKRTAAAALAGIARRAKIPVEDVDEVAVGLIPAGDPHEMYVAACVDPYFDYPVEPAFEAEIFEAELGATLETYYECTGDPAVPSNRRGLCFVPLGAGQRYAASVGVDSSLL